MEATTAAPAARSLAAQAVIVACVVFLAYAVSRPDAVATLGRLYDDVVYLSVGKSIADGTGYRSVHLVGSPVHVKFPPLLPLAYAGAWTMFGSLAAVASFAMWTGILATAVAAAVMWWIARRELGAGIILATLFVIVPLLTDRTMFYFTGAASEPWMLLGWSVALLLAARVARVPETDGGAMGASVALGVTLALTVLSRTQAIAVAVAIVVGVACMRVGRRALALTVGSMVVPLATWELWHRALMARGPLSPLPDQISYTAWIPTSGVGALTSFAARMARLSIPLYWTNTADLLVGWSSPKTLLIATGLLGCGLIGIALVMRRFPPLGLSLLAMTGVLAIWPYVQDRFLTPLLPVLGLAGAHGVQRVVDRLAPLVRRSALGVAAALALVMLAFNARMRIESVRGTARSPFAHAIDDMVGWIDANTRPNEHIMVPWGGALYLRTGRRTSIPNPEEATLAPSVFASPNRFLAGRIVADSVDAVIIWDRAPGRGGAALRNLAAACPGLMAEAPRDSATASTGLHFYRVQRDVPCLRAFATAESGTTGISNKNAP